MVVITFQKWNLICMWFVSQCYRSPLKLIFIDFMQIRKEDNWEYLIVDDCKYLSFPPAKQRNANNEPYDHMKDAAFFYDVTERFKKGMKLDPDFKTRNVEVNTISKVIFIFGTRFLAIYRLIPLTQGHHFNYFNLSIKEHLRFWWLSCFKR